MTSFADAHMRFQTVSRAVASSLGDVPETLLADLRASFECLISAPPCSATEGVLKLRAACDYFTDLVPVEVIESIMGEWVLAGNTPQ